MSTLTDTVYIGSGTGLVTSEVVKQTWHGLVVADQISILQWRSELVAAAGWHISASWQQYSYTSPVCWWWMQGKVVSALVGWRIYVLLRCCSWNLEETTAGELADMMLECQLGIMHNSQRLNDGFLIELLNWENYTVDTTSRVTVNNISEVNNTYFLK